MSTISSYPHFLTFGKTEIMIEYQGSIFRPSTWLNSRETLPRGDRLYWWGPWHFAVCKLD